MLRSQLPCLETTEGLVRGAVAVSMHELADADASQVERGISAIADSVRRRVRGTDARALAAHLHHVLFDDLGFTGNVEHYDDPANSYLPLVLERRTGLPITLSLLYRCVAERVGLACVGVNAPWHFIASVTVGDDTMLVDPFHGGRTLKVEEAFEQMSRMVGASVPRDERLLAAATHRQWLARICRNLVNAFHRAGRDSDRAAMHELESLLQ